MPQIIPVAVLLQTIGSFFFAYSAYLQDKVVVAQVAESDNQHRLDFATLWVSIRSPRWLLGLVLMGLSLACQITALSFAPVSIVQPVGVLAFPWSMIIQSRAHKVPIGPQARMAVVITVAAIFGFISIGGFNAAPEARLSEVGVLVGALVAYLCAAALGLFGARGAAQWRCLAWASGGAVFYGLEASLVKSLMEYAKTSSWVNSAVFWATLVALLIGSATAAWMVQQGYATGPAELVVASMTITSPVVAVLFGIAVLGEGAQLGPVTATSMILLGAIAIGGVIRLATLHPQFEDASARADQDLPANENLS